MSILKQTVSMSNVAAYNRRTNAVATWEGNIPKGAMLLPLITLPLVQVDGFVIHYMMAPPCDRPDGSSQKVVVMCATEDLFITDELFNAMLLGTYMEEDELVYVFANLLT